jgi:hypothetical protein
MTIVSDAYVLRMQSKQADKLTKQLLRVETELREQAKKAEIARLLLQVRWRRIHASKSPKVCWMWAEVAIFRAMLYPCGQQNSLQTKINELEASNKSLEAQIKGFKDDISSYKCVLPCCRSATAYRPAAGPWVPILLATTSPGLPSQGVPVLPFQGLSARD